MIRRILTATALAASLLAVPTAADASPTCNSVKVHRQREKGLNLYGNAYFNSCSRPHVGHSIRWLKPQSLVHSYRVPHLFLHPGRRCFPEGNMQEIIMRFYLVNPVTGYNAHTHLTLPCDEDGANADVKGLYQMPRCYMPWISSGGRAPDAGHRAWCKFRMTEEVVNVGPVPNDHYNLGSGWIVP